MGNLTVKAWDARNAVSLSNVLVMVRDPTATMHQQYTDANGIAYFGQVTISGVYHIDGVLQGYTARAYDINLAPAPPDFQMALNMDPSTTAQYQLMVIVYNAQTQQPINLATVIAGGVPKSTNTMGEVLFDIPQLGNYYVVITASGYQSWSQMITVGSNPQPWRFAVYLAPSTSATSWSVKVP